MNDLFDALNIFDLPDLRGKRHVFADRKQAGEILGDMLHAERSLSSFEKSLLQTPLGVVSLFEI